MRVRLILPHGAISAAEYELADDQDTAKIRTVIDSSGQRRRVHAERIISCDAWGKAIAVSNGEDHKGICPQCGKLFTVSQSQEPGSDSSKKEPVIHCPEHGYFEIARRLSQQMSAQKEPIMDQTQFSPKALLDYGELWVKRGISFDHAKIDVRAWVLLVDQPPRKICFNTYNGSLGQKCSNVAETLALDALRAGTKHKRIYFLTDSLDSVRQRLEATGFERFTG